MGMSRKIKQGYIPVGMSYIGTHLYVLYVKRRGNIRGWRIAPTRPSRSAMNRLIRRQSRYRYFPTGLSGHKRKVWMMFLRIPNSRIRRWAIRVYPINNRIFRSGISRMTSKRWMPWGFMIRYRKAVVLYVKVR